MRSALQRLALLVIVLQLHPIVTTGANFSTHGELKAAVDLWVHNGSGAALPTYDYIGLWDVSRVESLDGIFADTTFGSEEVDLISAWECAACPPANTPACDLPAPPARPPAHPPFPLQHVEGQVAAAHL